LTYHPYPRSLYRKVEHGLPEMNFDGVQCEMLTVESEEEENSAKKDGWYNSPAEAGNGGAVKADPAPAKPKSELADLRSAYKAKFGKNPSPKATVAQLREKLA
jgi:hypothetical protein